MTLDSLAASGYGQDSLALQKYYSDYAKYLAAQQGTQKSEQASTSSNVGGDSIKRAPEVKDNTTQAILLIALGIAATGAAVCFTKGKSAGAEGFFNRIGTGGKEIGKSIKNFFSGGAKKAASEAAESTAGRGAAATRNGHIPASMKPERIQGLVNNAQEYTIVRDGVTITMKNGKPIKIVTQESRLISNAIEIQNWVSRNGGLTSGTGKPAIIDGLNLSGQLDKNVRLFYEKVVNGNRYIFENGQVKEIIIKDGTNGARSLKGDAVRSFMKAKKNKAEVLEATKITQAFEVPATIPNELNGVISSGAKVNVVTSRGKIISVDVNGTALTREQCHAFRKAYANDFTRQYGRMALDPNQINKQYFEYVTKDGSRIRFDNSKEVQSIMSSSDPVTLSTTQELNNYFQSHKKLKSTLDSINSSGKLPKNFNFGEIQLKTEAGHTCFVGNNGHTLEKVRLSDGTELTDDLLKNWQNTEANRMDIEKILELLK